MTRGDAETAASAFVEAVQRIGTAGALNEVEEQVRALTCEELARHFAARPGAWTGLEVADVLRRWRWTR